MDLWSLDVEGFEFYAMSGMDWWGQDGDSDSTINIQAILMEQQEMTLGPCEQMNMDYRLTTLGYHKYRLVSDAFYYKAHNHGSLLYADSNSPHGGSGSRTELLDKYYHELESKRCQSAKQQVRFFTEQK